MHQHIKLPSGAAQSIYLHAFPPEPAVQRVGQRLLGQYPPANNVELHGGPCGLADRNPLCLDKPPVFPQHAVGGPLLGYSSVTR